MPIQTKISHKLVKIIAILLLVNSAGFSIYGLSCLFAGYRIFVIILASLLETAKVISIPYLFDNYKFLPPLRKKYIIVSISILMILTSVGVYGFMYAAYQETVIKLEANDGNISIFDQQLEDTTKQIRSIESQIGLDEQRFKTLMELRQQQEIRLTQIIQTYNKRLINSLRIDISSTVSDLNALETRIADRRKKVSDLMMDRNRLQVKKNEANTSGSVADIGPLKNLARLTKTSTGTMVNGIIFLIILAFDPFAMMLLTINPKEKKEKEKMNNGPKKKRGRPRKQRPVGKLSEFFNA